MLARVLAFNAAHRYNTLPLPSPRFAGSWRLADFEAGA